MLIKHIFKKNKNSISLKKKTLSTVAKLYVKKSSKKVWQELTFNEIKWLWIWPEYFGLEF